MISDHDLEEHVIGPKSQRKYLKALDHQLNLLDALTDESPSGEMNRRWTVNFFDSMVRDARKNQTSYMLGAASGPEDHDSNGLGYLRAMVDILDVARTYYIDANMIGFIADVADSMPDDVAPHIDDVPSDQGFMYLETPIRTVDRWGKEFFVSGIVWSCGEKGFGISEFILLDTDEDMLREVAYANDNDIPWYPPDMSLYHVDSVVWGAGLVSPDTYRQQWDEVIAKQASKFEALGAKFDHEQVDEFESLLSVLWIRRFVVASWAVMHGKIARPKAARKSKVQARALKRRGLDWGDIRIVELRATISQGDDDRPQWAAGSTGPIGGWCVDSGAGSGIPRSQDPAVTAARRAACTVASTSSPTSRAPRTCHTSPRTPSTWWIDDVVVGADRLSRAGGDMEHQEPQRWAHVLEDTPRI